MSRTLQAVREAATDGRLQNIIYRQNQLERLQKSLVDNVELVESAIKSDSGHSDAETAVEYVLTLRSLKDYYSSLDADEALHNEYAITRGEDAPAREEAIGIVYVVPSQYTAFYSVVVAVSAAIAAGNCVVIEFGITLQEVPALLHKLLKAALDPSIIEFVTSRAADADLGPNHVRIFQRDVPSTDLRPSSPTSSKSLISPSQSRVVAVVDRTADITEAAESLVTARFSFGGNSPYAPDVVLVNEYVKDAFLVAVVKELVRFRASLQAGKAIDPELAAETESLLEAAKKSNEVEVTTLTGDCSVFEVKNRHAELLRSKIGGRNLVVHSVRSLDDAISLADRGYWLASYIFAAPTSAKYLSQFIRSQVSFINQAPLELLVGPAALRCSPINRSLRYPIRLFSVPSPQYITPSPCSQSIHDCLRHPNANAIAKVLREVATKAEQKKKAPLRKQFGFFEQAIAMGLGMFGTAFLLSVGALGYFGLRVVRNRS